jgi:hypothetical protein
MSNSGCETQRAETETNSGVKKATVKVQTNADGNTVEQGKISDRVTNDNKPGAIKYLYCISPYSGQCIIYSTVAGKVTSSGKRLQPKTVIGRGNEPNLIDYDDNVVYIGNKQFLTNEVIQDDGTFGDSDPYIYWWDVRGVYHQHFMTGGQILHVSDAPLAVKSIVINIEELAKDAK